MRIGENRTWLLFAAIWCLLLQVGCSENEGASDPIFDEFSSLLSAADQGTAGDKLRLFLYTKAHTDVLAEYRVEVLQHLVEASNSGYGEASFWLGHISENGIWLKQNLRGAQEFYLLSAEQGDGDGMLACVTFFSQMAVAAESGPEKDSALADAQKWYEALEAIKVIWPDAFVAARFNLALARMKLDATDEYGMALFGEAALAGDTRAAALVRKGFADASSANFAGDEDAARVVEVWAPVIAEIGSIGPQPE